MEYFQWETSRTCPFANPVGTEELVEAIQTALSYTDTDRYQDRWKWFLPASRSFLNPPEPREKTKNLDF